MSKLTLSVDEAVIEKAKRYAKQNGTSISEMVESYLSAVADPQPSGRDDTPILRTLRGSLKKGDRGHYRKHLVSKYR